MYRAKWDGQNRYAVFESGMQDAVQSRMELEMDLRDALEHDEFFLVYQPTFDLRDMRPTGVEALIRWQHPARGVVQPDGFIPLLEETGLIVEVGRWVLREACRQGAAVACRPATRSASRSTSPARQLDGDEFVDDVAAMRSRTAGSTPERLTIEITETTLMRDVEETARPPAAIKDLGVRIAIDDFGTGYSSLAHLQRFPVDALKIDRSFMSGCRDNAEGETLIQHARAARQGALDRDLRRGHRAQQELTLLREEDCDNGQGFLFARPLDTEECETFLENWAERPRQRQWRPSARLPERPSA